MGRWHWATLITSDGRCSSSPTQHPPSAWLAPTQETHLQRSRPPAVPRPPPHWWVAPPGGPPAGCARHACTAHRPLLVAGKVGGEGGGGINACAGDSLCGPGGRAMVTNAQVEQQRGRAAPPCRVDQQGRQAGRPAGCDSPSWASRAALSVWRSDVAPPAPLLFNHILPNLSS